MLPLSGLFSRLQTQLSNMKSIIIIPAVLLMPFFVFGTIFPGTNGSVTSSQTINLSTYYESTEAVIDVSSGINLSLTSGKVGICFKIESNTNIILNGTNFENSASGACGIYIHGTNNTITIQGNNTIHAGSSYPAIYVANGGAVTIKGDGFLRAIGATGSAAIGSNDTYSSGDITIEGTPTILAEAGSGGAAIGGGLGQNAVNITINGGDITAEAGSGGAAGIGGGGMVEKYGSYVAGCVGTITITGGTVSASGSGGGAGIGGGGRSTKATVSSGKFTAINISDGDINATGGSDGGCGIGKGSNASTSGGNINISGGRVVSTGKLGGAGIGGGYNSSSPAITISGGEVYAEGSSYNSYTLGDDVGNGGNIYGAGYYTLTINGSTTAVFGRYDRWLSEHTISLTHVSDKFDGICVNKAYGYSFPPWNMSPTTIANAYGYIKQYTAYFKSNGGDSYYKYDKVSPVEDITPPTTNPTRTGYSFSDWYSETACTNLFVFTNHTISTTTYIYAGWIANSYELTFDINTGTDGSMAKQTIVFNESIQLPANDYSKTGYLFDSWNTKADGSGTAYDNQSSYKMTTEGATLYTIWTPVTYTVSFDGNTNTSGSTADQVFTYDTPQNLTANGFIKTGYIFNGWNSVANGSGTTYTDGENVSNLTTKNDSTISIYGQWLAREYSISYNLDNGTNNVANPVTYNIESEDIILADATKEGYTFTGWYNDAVFSSRITTIAQGSTGDIELYAKFSPENYSITYHLDNGSNNSENPNTYNIETEDIVLADATKEGYVFIGWYNDAAFSLRVTTIAQGSTGDVELYAKYTPQNYLITYNLNKGTNDVANPTTYNIESSDIILANATKVGYNFVGWYNDAAFSSKVTTIPQGSTGEVELYAMYTLKNYLIVYDLDNGTNDAANPATYNIRTASIILADATKVGYNFIGWYNDANFSSQITTIPQGTTGNIELYAKFAPISYSITYYPYGGSNDTANPVTYNIESADITLADATKEGYTFSGWYANADFITQITTIEQGSTGDIELYARYIVNNYTVTFLNWDGELLNLQNIDYGSRADVPSDTVRSGYLFEGWFTDNNIQITDFSDITNDLTVTARYVLATAAEYIHDNTTVKIYPNPVTNGKLYIEAYSEIDDIIIFDIMGRVLYVNTDTASSQIIDVNNWISGVYFLRIANQTHKFIIK